MDWNEDGCKDLLVGEFGGKVSYYRNVGSAGSPELTFDGYLMAAGSVLNVYNNSCPFSDDWNEDGLKDLLVGSSDGRIWLYINIGTNANPVFGQNDYVRLANGTIIEVGARSAPVVADLDGDGLKDLIVGQITGPPYFYENQGTNASPLFSGYDVLKTGSVSVNPGNTSRWAPIDWNGDGTVDLVSGSMDARLKLYLQSPYTPSQPVIDLNYTGPWQIPQSGTILDFTCTLENPSSAALTLDIWSEARLPDGTYPGPLLSLPQVLLPAYGSISRDLNQNLPASAPAGLYYYIMYAGNQREFQVFNYDEFDVYKTNYDGGKCVHDWACAGWDLENLGSINASKSDQIHLTAFPNPFNPITTLHFAIPEPGCVEVTIFDAAGRKVVSLANGYRAAGEHDLTWNVESLPSGMHIAQIKIKESSTFKKLQLTK